MFTTHSGAIFNSDRTHRSLLWRIWDAALPPLLMIMLNPSEAGEERSDPTVTRQMERAKRLSLGGLAVANAFSIVSPYPRDIKKARIPNLAENDHVILSAAERTVMAGGMVIAAWGPHAIYRDRNRELLRLLDGIPLRALILTKDGHPGHPLYLAYDITPFPYPPPAAVTQEEEVW